MRVKVELEIDVPDGVSIEELKKFFQYEFNYDAHCNMDNPMFDDYYDYSVEEFHIEVV